MYKTVAVIESLLTGSARVMKSFTYGTSGTSNGKLRTAVRNNDHDTPANVVITETYSYGGRQGRVSARTVAASSGASATFGSMLKSSGCRTTSSKT
jgi:hypothetical protein